MTANNFTLRPPQPEHDFEQMAALLSAFETEPTTPDSLLEWHRRETQQGMRMTVAQAPQGGPQGGVAGFVCLYRRGDPAKSYFDLYLIVAPGHRRQGLGERLYRELLRRRQSWGRPGCTAWCGITTPPACALSSSAALPCTPTGSRCSWIWTASITLALTG